MIFFHILKVPPLTSIIVFPVGFKTRLMLKLRTSTIDLWRARETSTGDSFFLSSTWQPRRKSSSQRKNPCSHGMKRQARYLNNQYLFTLPSTKLYFKSVSKVCTYLEVFYECQHLTVIWSGKVPFLAPWHVWQEVLWYDLFHHLVSNVGLKVS